MSCPDGLAGGAAGASLAGRARQADNCTIVGRSAAAAQGGSRPAALRRADRSVPCGEDRRDPGDHASPFYYKTSQLPPDEAPPFAAEWVRKVTAYRETLTRARPDLLVMIGSDHFHQLWLSNMPQFLIGKAPFYDANYYNEAREFGLPRQPLRGHEEPPHTSAEGLTRGSTWRSSTSCGSTTDYPPDLHRAARRTTCRSCRSTPTSSRRPLPRPSGSSRSAGRCGDDRRLAERPAGGVTRDRAPVARAGRPAPVRAARAGPGVRRQGGGGGSPAATRTAAWPR